jgi:hypothetical protein
MNNTMNREGEQGMRHDFATWCRLRGAVGHGENEYEREQLIIKAEEITHRWQDNAWTEEWGFLLGLVDGWRQAPKVLAQVADDAMAGRYPELTDEEIRSIVQVRWLLDPAETSYEGWQRMHAWFSRLNARHSAAITINAPQNILDALERQMELHFDRSVWPPQWLVYEREFQHDTAFWAHQDSLFRDVFEQCIDLAEV